MARAMLEICRSEGKTQLLIHSRADVAVAIRADGVHLTSDHGELTPEQVRTLYSSASLPEPVISISCHTPAEVVRARDLGAELILFGPVFEKVVAAPGTISGDRIVANGTGLEILRTACSAAAPVAVLALGGVTEANAQNCIDAGASGIAGIRLFCG